MADIQLLLGLPQSGKTTRCLSAYAEALIAARGTSAAGRTLWLTPAREARQVVLERLLPLTAGVVFQPNVQTFDQFAERVLMESGQGGRVITSLARRLILRSVIRKLSESQTLAYFSHIAGTEGFLDVVSNFVSELKRAEIWPADYAAACRQRSGTMSPRDTELNFIYEAYQGILQDRNWYDAEGRFWLARTAMKEQSSGFWRELSLVVVDGFSDFTKTQQEILQQLALTAEQMLVTLPLERPHRRPELFAKPGGVLQQLQTMLQNVGKAKLVECGPRSESLPAGLAQIHAQLFENPREVQPLSVATGCAVVAATGDASEKAAVALRIKRLLGDGVSPREIVVGLRSVAVSGQAWTRDLQAAGLPVWCEAPLPWSRSPYLKALFGVLQLELEDWTFDRLQGVLTSSLFRPPLPEWNAEVSPRCITGLLRRGKLHSQRNQILRGIERWLQRVTDRDPGGDLSDLQLAFKILTHLAEICQSFSKPADLAGWADRLANLTTRLGLAPVNSADSDRRDADQLQRLLRAAAIVEQELSDPPQKRTLDELLVILRDLVQSDPPGGHSERPGCVRIVGAETLRHLQPRFVFLVELTEETFPSRRAEDCLFSEAERVRLHQAGLSLGHRELHQREEMLLFYLAVTRATGQLTLSYSQVNDKGHEVYPSPYVTAVEQLFEPHSKVFTREGGLDPVPDRDHILTSADLRLAAVSEARKKHPGWWRLLLENSSSASTAQNLLAAANVADQRFHTHGFTPWEGRLTNPLHQARLAQSFGPDRQFSATELESYAACPFRFWMSSVLELDPLPSPEEATDFAGRGSLVHQVLAKLADEKISEAPAVSQRFRELVEERLQRHVGESELQQALLKVERQLLDRWAEAYGEQHGEYHAQVAEQKLIVSQTLSEIPFGAARDAEDAAPQKHFPALVLRSEETVIRLGGRIDRVDVAEYQGQTVFTVIDYKTGAKPTFKWDDVAAGRTLQLAIYTLAVSRLQIAGPDAVPHQMGYWTVRQTGFTACGGAKSGSPLDDAVRDSLERVLSESISKLVAGIRQGVFIVENADEQCTGRCPYHTVCRVNQIRPLADRLEKRRADLLSITGAGT